MAWRREASVRGARIRVINGRLARLRRCAPRRQNQLAPGLIIGGLSVVWLHH